MFMIKLDLFSLLFKTNPRCHGSRSVKSNQTFRENRCSDAAGQQSVGKVSATRPTLNRTTCQQGTRRPTRGRWPQSECKIIDCNIIIEQWLCHINNISVNKKHFKLLHVYFTLFTFYSQYTLMFFNIPVPDKSHCSLEYEELNIGNNMIKPHFYFDTSDHFLKVTVLLKKKNSHP